MSITGPKSRENFQVNACIGIDCAARDILCNQCVKINGKYTHFVERKEDQSENSMRIQEQ